MPKHCFPLSCAFCKGCYLPQRYITAVMVFLGLVVTYIMRVQVNFSITVMTIHSASAPNASSDACNVSTDANEKHVQYGTLDWDIRSQNLLLGTFYYGYMLTQVPAGIIADRWGAKWPYGVGVAVVAICHIFTPLVIKWGGSNVGYYLLCVLRVFQGIGSACVFPLISPFVAAWIPPMERGKFATLMFSGAHIGCFVANLATGYMTSATKSWEFPFYIFGAVAVVWFIFFLILCYSNYEQHPYITEKELEMLRETIPQISRKGLKTPWKKILTSCTFWTLISINIGHDFSLYTIVNELPVYMSTMLKYSVNSNALVTSLPYITEWSFAMISGVISDLLLKKHCMSLTKVRKLFVCISLLGSGVFMLIAIYMGCRRTLVVVLFCITMGFVGIYYCAAWVNYVDVAPTYAGTITSISNSCGAVQGFLSSAICAALVHDNTYSRWQIVFWITAGVVTVPGILYAIFGTAVRQQWDIDGAGTIETTTAPPAGTTEETTDK